MQIKSRHIIYAVVILILLLILIVSVFPGSVLRIILGLPLVLFSPGYVLVSTIFPGKIPLKRLEKFVLSIGVSIAVVSLTGLAISFTPWGIGLYPFLTALSIFTVVFSVAAWFRQRSLPEAEKPAFTLPQFPGMFRDFNRTEKILAAVLAVMVVAAIGVVTFVVTSPRTGDRFTEFYILDKAGKTVDYPACLHQGERGEVVVTVVNHEQQPESYTLEVRMEGLACAEVLRLDLADGEKWEDTVSFIPTSAGEGQKVEFLLYLSGQSEVYQYLYIWVDVEP